MSFNLNTVLLGGHLTRDPELRTVGNDRTVVAFGIAINRRYKGNDGETKEDTTFVDCEAWGRTAELIGQYLAKGSNAFFEGRLRLDSWQDKDGQKRSRLKVVVDQVQFIGAPKSKDDNMWTGSKNEPAPAGASKVKANDDEPPF